MKTLFLYIVKKEDPVLAGLTATEWLIRGAGEIPYRVIEEGEIPSLPASDYVALLTSATPLVTAKYLLTSIEEMERRGILGLEIGEGRLVRSDAYREGYRPKRRASAAAAKPITSPAEARAAEKVLFERIATALAEGGAIIPDTSAVRIDARSVVESGATVEPYTVIGNSVVESGARIGSFSEIEDSFVGRGACVRHSVVCGSRIGERTTVGPFAYLRAGATLGEGCRIGDFVEVKNSTLGAGVKAAHLSYIGDASVGERTNVGCGTVFCNYDGREKHRTTVGESVFIGANTNLVAPVKVGDGAYIAAATTVTKDVPSGAFVIGRVRAGEKPKK